MKLLNNNLIVAESAGMGNSFPLLPYMKMEDKKKRGHP